MGVVVCSPAGKTVDVGVTEAGGVVVITATYCAWDTAAVESVLMGGTTGVALLRAAVGGAVGRIGETVGVDTADDDLLLAREVDGVAGVVFGDATVGAAVSITTGETAVGAGATAAGGVVIAATNCACVETVLTGTMRRVMGGTLGVALVIDTVEGAIGKTDGTSETV